MSSFGYTKEKKHFHYTSTQNAFYLSCVLDVMFFNVSYMLLYICVTHLCVGVVAILFFLIASFNPLLMLFDLNIALISRNQ